MPPRGRPPKSASAVNDSKPTTKKPASTKKTTKTSAAATTTASKNKRVVNGDSKKQSSANKLTKRSMTELECNGSGSPKEADESGDENMKRKRSDDEAQVESNDDKPVKQARSDENGRKRSKIKHDKPTPSPLKLKVPKVIRSTFNPLPRPDPLFRSSDPNNQFVTNIRSNHPLNQFQLTKPDWLQHFLAKHATDLNHSPERHLLMFGSGDMGQMGLGIDKLEDIKRPKIHDLVESLKGESQLALGPETVACGGMHSLLIDCQGKIFSWGINDHHALGRSTEGNAEIEQEELESTPRLIEDLAKDLDKFRPVRIEAGDSVSVAISDQGELRAWGSFRSNDGLLGFDGEIGSSIKQLQPIPIHNLMKYEISQVCCGYDHVLALSTGGQVFSWGNGQQHQLGRKIIERRKINGLRPERLSLKKIVLIGTGGSHSFAVNVDGEVYGWGLNTRSQLGIDPENSLSREEIVGVPTIISSMSPKKHDGARVIGIHGGDFHTLFLLNNGEVWSVGNYENGEIGISLERSEIVENEKQREIGKLRKKGYIEERMKIRKQKYAVALKKYDERKANTKKELKTEGVDKEEKDEEDEEERPEWDEFNEMMEVEQEVSQKNYIPAQAIKIPIKIEFERPIIDISTGTRHNLAIDIDGNCFSWGLGQSNELGLGKNSDGDEIDLVFIPNLLKSKDLNQIKTLACFAGGTHSTLIGIKSI